MSEHTPEPWEVVPHDEEMPDDGFEILGSDGETACDDGSAWGEYNRKMSEANARRIVACVNACRGFSIEEIEGSNLSSDSIESQNEIDSLTRERDEARAMVKRLADALRNLDNCDDYEELIDEADPLNMPETTMCPSCYFVWPGHPTRCEACHTILDEEPHA